MRKSGILLPVSSLPSKYGIGCFSKEAYKFIDRLKEAGQAYWQILPLGPTSYGDSPYQSFSTFAGNPYFIDPEDLVARGRKPSVRLWSQRGCETFHVSPVCQNGQCLYGKRYGSKEPTSRHCEYRC